MACSSATGKKYQLHGNLGQCKRQLAWGHLGRCGSPL